MSWFGKLLGGAVGFAIGGPIGALVGVALGHNLDRGASSGDERFEDFSQRERTQTAFFTATFAVMGHLAKADGRVTADEIEMARRVMDELRLSPQQRALAQRLFAEGKSADFPLDDVLEQFRRECHRSRNLIAMFVEVLVHAAYADGVVATEERRVLERVCGQLSIGPAQLAHIEAMIRAGARMNAESRERDAKTSLADAYGVLGVESTSPDAEIKRAYRRLMSRHHPDKLVSKGLPEEMVRLATERTQEVKLAYDRVKEARGI